MANERPITVTGNLAGCMYGDSERVHTLADVDWLSRKLTVTFRDRIMGRLIEKYHKAPSFVIDADLKCSGEGNRVTGLTLSFCTLNVCDPNLDRDMLECAEGCLRSLLGVESLKVSGDADTRVLLNAISREIPQIRNQIDF